MPKNFDARTVESFGDEWFKYPQDNLQIDELRSIFDDYFKIFPWDNISLDSVGFDMGCGSGRWAQFVAPRVAQIHCIDPSAAICVAQKNLAKFDNVFFHANTTDSHSLPEASFDFGYSLGVLHHLPDPMSALIDCVRLLKPGAPFLAYIYYSLDNRSVPYKLLWRLSNVLRTIISRMPLDLRSVVTDIIALSVYYPLSRLSLILEKFGMPVSFVPLSYYRRSSIATLRTDSRDRFGTPLELRFSAKQLFFMFHEAGLVNIQFSPEAPYWCILGFKSGA